MWKRAATVAVIVAAFVALAIWLDAFGWWFIGAPLGIWLSVKMTAEEKKPIRHSSSDPPNP